MATTNEALFMPVAKRMKFNDPVRIEVGPENNREIFTTNAEILTSRSLFFRKALSGGFKEAKERVVRLPEDDAETFGVYLHYLQTNELSVLPDSIPKDYIGNEERALLAQLYVLAEKFQDTKSKNATIRALIASSYAIRSWKGWCWFPNARAIAIIYSGTTSGSMGRKLVVDITAWDCTSFGSILSDRWPQEFLSELALELLTHRNDNHDKKKQGWRKHHPEEYMEKET